MIRKFLAFFELKKSGCEWAIYPFEAAKTTTLKFEGAPRFALSPNLWFNQICTLIQSYQLFSGCGFTLEFMSSHLATYTIYNI